MPPSGSLLPRGGVLTTLCGLHYVFQQDFGMKKIFLVSKTLSPQGQLPKSLWWCCRGEGQKVCESWWGDRSVNMTDQCTDTVRYTIDRRIYDCLKTIKHYWISPHLLFIADRQKGSSIAANFHSL
jgi:hypothetical protein